jgi:hypothetical protein
MDMSDREFVTDLGRGFLTSLDSHTIDPGSAMPVGREKNQQLGWRLESLRNLRPEEDAQIQEC